jgi:hypothetical protein
MIPALPARRRIQLQGIVRGLGFQPFVYRIAQRLDIGAIHLTYGALERRCMYTNPDIGRLEPCRP